MFFHVHDAETVLITWLIKLSTEIATISIKFVCLSPEMFDNIDAGGPRASPCSGTMSVIAGKRGALASGISAPESDCYNSTVVTCSLSLEVQSTSQIRREVKLIILR